MQSLTKILDEVYSELSLSETINRNQENKFLEGDFKEVWEVKTEVEVGNFQKEISLLLAFERFFPLNIPRIYLSKESYDEIYPIPHIDKNYFVCTFHTDSLILDKNNPSKIVRECLQRAKRIIKEGIEGTNHNDFQDELGAYWTDTEESDYYQYLSLLTDFPKETTLLKICELQPAYNHIKYLLYKADKDDNTKFFLNLVLSKGHKGTESKALFLGDYEISSKPPFPENNEDILKTITRESLEEYKKYINSKTHEKHVFFVANKSSKPTLLGWKHKELKTKKNGFRQGSLTQFMVLNSFQLKDKIKRIFVNEYSNNRIENRTSGRIRKKYDFLIAGLGSIGSNLVYFLNGLNYPNFKLIDNDFLKIENIGRHLLGINNVNSAKVNAIESYIKNIRPDQNVSVKQSKFESVVVDDINYINDCNYAFVAIGNQNIENLIIEKINEGKITIPFFLLWVEPYAIGGHCIFVHPKDKVSLENLYNGFLYRFNIIDSSEYLKSNPVLSKQEAGCQTSYTPYSGNDVILFLSSIYKWMNDVIKDDTEESIVVQWTGNINLAHELKLTINPQYMYNDPYSYKLIQLNNDNQNR